MLVLVDLVQSTHLPGNYYYMYTVPPTEPMITGQSIIEELETLMLQCQSSGSPVPNIIWVKRSDEEVTAILNSQRTIINRTLSDTEEFPTAISSLYIYNMMLTDGGEYVCEAKNGVATSSVLASLYVNVTGKLIICN